jgi:uncharacterized protein (TIGR00369 family)
MAAPGDQQIKDGIAGFEQTLGLVLGEVSDTEAFASVRVRDELKQPYGLVHGGVYASIAESLASWATGIAVQPRGCIALGMGNSTSFLRPITQGVVHARAWRIHAGRTTWIWDVECRDDEERLCAVTRMTIAVRPMEEAPQRLARL